MNWTKHPLGEFLLHIYNSVILVSVAGLTALSGCLLRRRFLLRRNDNCSQVRERNARRCERLALALRAGEMVIWNARRLI